MELSNSFEKSLNILRQLQSSTEIENYDKWRASIWINGREEGFCLYNRSGEVRIIFSEARHSDLIVIYFCFRDGFNEDENMITNETYRNARYCEEKEAFEIILNLMRVENWI